MKTRIDSSKQRRENMNWDEAGNNWERFKRLVEDRWNDLSSDQVSRIAGRREKLQQELQRTYGLSEHQADMEIKRFESGQVGETLTGSGRGATERAREFGSGNQPDEGVGKTRH